MERGYYVAPTLLAGCKADMTPVKEEIFGPVVVVVPFDDDDEASRSPTAPTTASTTT